MKAKISLIHLLGSSLGLVLLVTGVVMCGLEESASAALTHRYSFATDASDSVGGANGTLMNGAYVSNGQAYFGGATPSGPNADYIDLPPGLISNYTSVTFEFWVDVGANGNWEELYAFGTQDSANHGANMVMFTPHSGSNPNDYRMSYAQASPGYNDEYVVNGVGVLDGLGEMSVDCVYDPPNQSMSLYTNGVLVATMSPVTARFSLTNVYDVHSWLGRSLYNGDASYSGSIDEFRIFNTALGPLQVAVDNAAGPGTVVTNISVNSITWNVNANMTLGERQDSTVTFNTANYGTFTVPGSTEATYTTSDPNIATVDVHGRLFATGIGTATVSAIYNGTTNNVTLTVGEPQLVHRYSFTTDASDSVGGANGTLVGDATVSGGAAVLPEEGLNSGDAGVSFVDLPNNLVTNLTAITIEIWATDNGSRNWARLWDLGNSSGGEGISDTGSRYMFLSLPSGNADLLGAIHVSDRAGGDQGLEWANNGRPPVAKEADMVWVQDPAHHTGFLYADGALVGVNTNMTLTPQDIGPTVNDWLGRSQYNDPMFKGTIDEFRIWNGVLSPLRVAINAAVGPDTVGPSDAGALQAVHLALGNQIVKGGRELATATADFASVSNVTISTLGTVYSSSDTSIATVDASGLVRGVSVGTATVTAAYQGKSDSQSVSVVIKPALLTHRWSFSETSGDTVADSVGGANGTLQGGAILQGDGTVFLDGVAGYVQLPGHLIDGDEAVSFETWVTVDPSTLSDSSARLFAFGSVDGVNEVGVTALSAGGNTLIRYFGPPTLTAVRQKGLNFSTGQKIDLVAVFDPPLGTVDLYLNGSWQNSATNYSFSMATITNLVSQLGANLGATNFTASTFDEFRIYNGALDLYRIRTDFAAGPNNVVTNPGTPVTLTLKADASMVQGSSQVPHVTASFTAVTNVDLTQTAEVTYSSSDPSVLSITSDGLVHAVAPGTATVTASLNAVQSSQAITVFPKQVMLVHRYSFNTDASDSVGAQDGTLFGNAQVVNGQATFDGDGNSYIELPSRLISTYDAATLELWTSLGANGNWARLYDFGHYSPNGDGNGTAYPYAFLCPHTGSTTARAVLKNASEAVLDFGAALDGVNNLQIAVVYDPPTDTELVYTNGVLAGSASLGGRTLSALDDLKCWLGRSMWSGDSGLTGSIDEFRIYAGALSASQVSADFTAGPGTVVLPPPVSAGPRISIARSQNNVVLSWLASATGYALQTSASLGSSASWSPVSASPVATNGVEQVTLPISDSTAFYRLSK